MASILVGFFIFVIIGVIAFFQAKKRYDKKMLLLIGVVMLVVYIFIGTIIGVGFYNLKIADNNRMNYIKEEHQKLENCLQSGNESYLCRDYFRENYRIEAFSLYDGRLLLKLYNDNDFIVSGDYFIDFINDGKKIDIPNQGYIPYVDAYSFAYSIVYSYDYEKTHLLGKYMYDNVDVYLEKVNYYQSCRESIKYDYNVDGNTMFITGTTSNPSEFYESVFAILFYDKEGKIVDFKEVDIYYLDLDDKGNFSDKRGLYTDYPDKENLHYELIMENAKCKIKNS